jgi:4'-phosphopantetheinyl transferase
MTPRATRYAPRSDWLPPPERLTLTEGLVDAWRVGLDSGTTDASLLSVEERERASRFRFSDDRARWVAAHLSVRRVLARYLGTLPEHVVLDHGEHDKPRVAAGRGDWLRFNLAHSGSVALVGVARGCEIGIDIEARVDRPHLLDIARRVFDPSVVAALEAVPAERRDAAFYPAWVRHEAQMKCRGTGLTDSEGADDADLAVIDLDAGPGYCAALATVAAPERVRLWDWDWA